MVERFHSMGKLELNLGGVPLAAAHRDDRCGCALEDKDCDGGNI